VRWTVLRTRLVRSLVAGTPRPGVPELVLVPGLGALGYVLPTVRECAAETRVHLLDVPGFGHRATAGLPADLAATADAVTGWLQEADLGPVLLFGHSTGAQAALRAAAAVPARVDRLVLGGITFAPRDRRAAPLLRAVAATVRHERRPRQVAAVLPYYLRGARGLPALLRSSLADRPEDAVGAVSAPVLVLRGAHDALCPADWAGALAGLAADGRCAVVPGAHNVPWTCPAGTAQGLRTGAR